MVGNKAQKAVAAALTGVLAMGGIAPAFAGVWTDGKPSWYRVDGSHEATYQLGTFEEDEGEVKSGTAVRSGMSGTEFVAGENRYDTNFDSINYNFNRYKGTKYVVLASGTSYADSLVAAGVAGMLAEDQSTGQTNGDSPQKKIEVPVVITPGDKLCIQAKRAIKALASEYVKANSDKDFSDFTVYIVGGTAAVSKDVENAVKDIEKDDENVAVERLAGDNRMETSLVAAKVVDDDGWLDDDLAESNNAAYIANGWAAPDALSVSSSAYHYGQPILLTDSDGKLSEDQLDYLKKLDEHVKIAVIGGPAQPSADQLWTAGVTRAGVDYIAGTNRYETSAAVIEWHVDKGFAFSAIAVASGANDHMADALIGGAFVGANQGVLALVDGVDEVTALKEAYAKIKKYESFGKSGQHYKAPANAFIIGGESAVSKQFAKKLNDNFPVTDANA